MPDNAYIALAREFCASHAEARGNAHTAECYRSGAWDSKGEMPIAVAMTEWMAAREAPCVWPSNDASVRSCTARSVLSLTLSSWTNALGENEDVLAAVIDEHQDRIVSVVLEGLGIDPDARAS